MSKRAARPVSSPAARYPTLERFDERASRETTGRRQALQRLGGTLLGALGLGALASACGDRALATDAGPPDHRFPINEGAAPMPDSRLDRQLDQEPEWRHSVSDGLPRMPDARRDLGTPPTDAAGDHAVSGFDLSAGVAPMPDARVDDAKAEPEGGSGG